MRRIGIWMVVFVVLNFALPRLGYDLTWFEHLGGARAPAALGLIVGGIALVGLGSRKKRTQ